VKPQVTGLGLCATRLAVGGLRLRRAGPRGAWGRPCGRPPR
jgi:hypothetical protein